MKQSTFWKWFGCSAVCATLALSGCGGDSTSPQAQLPITGRVVFASTAEDANGDIYLLNINANGSAGMQRLTQNSLADYRPALSPDHRWLAYVETANDNDNIRVVELDNDGIPKENTRKSLTNDDLGNDFPGWSPNSDTIYFSRRYSDATHPAGIYSVPVTGGIPVLVRENGCSPCCSPTNANRLAFVDDGDQAIYIMTLGSGNPPTRVVNFTNGMTISGLAWSPDGSLLAFGAYPTAGGDGCIYATNPDTPVDNPSALPLNGDNGAPVWTDNSHLAYFSGVAGGNHNLLQASIAGGIPTVLKSGFGDITRARK